MTYYPKQGTKREEALQILHDKGPLDGSRLAEELGFNTRRFKDCIWPLANHGLVVHERMPNSPARGFPALVLDAADIDMPDLGEMPDRDVVEYYGFKVVTDKGEMVVDYRNDSNGYYGGNLTWPGQSHYGGVYGQNVAIHEWRGITKDE